MPVGDGNLNARNWKFQIFGIGGTSPQGTT